MNKDAHIQMLVALRAQVEAMHATINSALSVLVGPVQEEDASGCRHPPEARIDTTTMGGLDSWQCRLCGHAQMGSVNQQG